MPQEWGRVVESVVGSHLVNQAISNDFKVYYWRDRSNEVDFVLERGEETIAIEVKSSFLKNITGMEAFKKRFNPTKTYLVDNKTFPCVEFLKLNPVELF